MRSQTSRHRTSEDIALGQRIRQMRQSQHLSQTALADRLGISFQQLQKYEQGRNRLSATRLATLAQALHTTPHDLLCWGVEEKPELTIPHAPSPCRVVERKAAELWRRIQNERTRKALMHLMVMAVGEAQEIMPAVEDKNNNQRL